MVVAYEGKQFQEYQGTNSCAAHFIIIIIIIIILLFIFFVEIYPQCHFPTAIWIINLENEFNLLVT